MKEGFQVHHPMLFFIPIMALLLAIQLTARRRQRQGLEPQEWPRTAMILIVVALGFLIVFTR